MAVTLCQITWTVPDVGAAVTVRVYPVVAGDAPVLVTLEGTPLSAWAAEDLLAPGEVFTAPVPHVDQVAVLDAAPYTGWWWTVEASVGDVISAATLQPRRGQPAWDLDLTLTAQAMDAAGRAITSTITQYAVGASETVPPVSGWSTDTPIRTPGAFVWMRSIHTYGDGSTSQTAPVLVTGNIGLSVVSVAPFWRTVTTGNPAPAKPTTTTPPPPWSGTEPAYTVNTELYRVERTLLSDDTFTYSDVSKVSAYEAAVQAMTTATGKNSNTYSSSATPPTTEGRVEGDTHRQMSGLDVVKTWRLTSGAWAEYTTSGAVLSHLDAATIDVNTIAAATAFVAAMRAKGVMLVNDQDEIVLNLTGVGDQTIALLDPATGNVVAGMDDDGKVVGRIVAANQGLTYQGRELADILAVSPQGTVAYGSQSITGRSAAAGQNIAFMELTFDVVAGRDYLINCDAVLLQPTSGATVIYWMRATTNGTSPQISTPVTQYIDVSATGAADFRPTVGGAFRYPATTTGTVRALFGIKSDNAACSIPGAGWGGSCSVTVLDMGRRTYANTGVNRTDTDGAPQSPAVKKTYETTWWATGHRSFKNNGATYDGGAQGLQYAMQGYTPYLASAGLQMSEIYFDSASIRAALSGATVNAISLYVKNSSFHLTAGGTARIYRHNNATPGATAVGHSSLIEATMARGEGRWIDLPTSFGDLLKNNSAKGVAFNPNGSTGGQYYGQFVPAETRIWIQYTK